MTRFVQIALYSAIMFAIAWGLWQVVPGWTDGLIERIGVYPAFFGGIALIALCYAVAYLTGRSDSGSAREP